jgi:uncharacterized protein DUF4169
MGEIVNLRRARKRQKSAQKEAIAAVNRVAFGVSKKARAEAETERALAQARLDGHRLPEQGD